MSVKSVFKTKSVDGKSDLLKRIIAHKELYIMMLPAIIFFIIYKYIPMYGVTIAFKDYYPALGYSGSKWVGLKHFNLLFKSPEFVRVLRNTLLFSFYKLAINFPLVIILALLLDELRNLKFKKIVQTILYLPHFISWVIISGIIYNLLSLDGVLNYVLGLFGKDPILLLMKTQWFRTIIVSASLWKGIGWGTIIYLAALSGVNPELYEACRVDGATRLQRIWHVTLPSIKYVIAIMLILRMGNILEGSFDEIFLLYNPITYSVGEIFETYVFRMGIEKGRYSFSTALGLFQNVVGLVLVAITNYASKKLTETGIW